MLVGITFSAPRRVRTRGEGRLEQSLQKAIIKSVKNYP